MRRVVLAPTHATRDRSQPTAHAVAEHAHGEVRADGDRVIYRILFAEEGKRGRILLGLDGFQKKTQKTPPAKIALAERRLRDWRQRGASPG